jgi:protein-tyrosine kinase
MQASTNKIIALANPECIVSEAYRLLSANIQHSSLNKDSKVFLVTSSSPGEGKTTVAANLAVTLAEQNKKVLLIDANLRKPMLHQLFLNSNAIGLTNILNNMVRVEEDLLQSCSNNLYLIPSGPVPAYPSGLFSSTVFDGLLADMKKQFDVILIDSPSVLSLADVPLMAARCDGVLLVIHSKKGKKAIVKQAMSKLRSVHANVIGAVMNDQRPYESTKNFYYYQGE